MEEKDNMRPTFLQLQNLPRTLVISSIDHACLPQAGTKREN